jgi:hypothetical protein
MGQATAQRQRLRSRPAAEQSRSKTNNETKLLDPKTLRHPLKATDPARP